MQKKRIAAIDIGSNAPKMLIAEPGEMGRPKVIESIRANLALGIDTYNNQFISEDSLRRLCDLLSSLRNKLIEYRVEDFRIVSTSAVREAINRDFVIARIKQLTGFNCEVLSNSQERYYHNLALSENFDKYSQLLEEGAIVLDLGAGSIQVSSYRHGKRLMTQNLKLGYLRVSELFSQLQSRAENFTDVMNEYISSQLTALRINGITVEDRWHLIMVGNDLDRLRNFAGLEGKEDNFLNSDTFFGVYEKLLNLSPLELSLNHGMPPDVAEIVLPSAMILYRFLKEYMIDGVYFPQVQLGHGILLEMAKKLYKFSYSHDHSQDLIASVKNVAVRFGGDVHHLEATERDALAIANALGKKYSLDKRFKLLLQTAVWMSQIGRFIHSVNYHIYSAEIVEHMEFIGLSDRESNMLSQAIRFIPGNDVPVDQDLDYHSYSFRFTVLQLTAILRIAEAIESARLDRIRDISVNCKKSILTIQVTSPADLTLERWAVSERSKLLKELFGMDIIFKEVNEGEL